MPPINYTSQVGQDKWVIEEGFKGMTHGFFVEIGAGDGIALSNTYVLETEFQWDGLCVEPNSVSFEQLKKNRKCAVDNSFVLDGVKEIDFHQYSGNPPHWECFSSMFPIEFLENQPEVKKEIIKMKSVSLGQLIRKYNFSSVIHYLSVDTEYVDLEILDHFFTKELAESRTIICISIEHNFKPLREQFRELLIKNRFVWQKELCQDDVYLNQDFTNLLYL